PAHGRALRSLYFRDRAAAGPDLPPTHLAKERVKLCPTLLLHLGLIWLLRKDRISLIPLTSGMATIPIRPALQGVDRAFLLTGYTIDMMRQSKDFLNIAKKVGVKQIVHLGACRDNDTRVAHYAWHQFIQRYIEWCGFSFTHLRPEIFMQNLLGYGGENYVKNGVIRHYIGKARWSWVDIEDVAAVAAASLLDPEKHNGQIY